MSLLFNLKSLVICQILLNLAKPKSNIMKPKILLFGIGIFSVCATSAQISTDSMVGYWPFIGNANDVSGNSHHGIVIGANLTSDRFGNSNEAYHFGGEDYIIVQDNDSLTFSSSDFTISAWIRIESFSTGAGYYLMGHSTGPGNTAKWILFISSSNIAFVIGPSIGWNILGNFSFNLDTWYYIAVRRSGSSLAAFVDSSLVGSVSLVGDIPNPNAPLHFGTAEFDRPERTFKGDIDEIRIYKRALASEELNLLYREGKCFQTVYDTIKVYDTVTIYKEISITDTLIIDVLLTGVQPPDDINTLKVYPNPAKDYLNINTGNYSEMTDYSIKIINDLGATVFETKVTQPAYEINLSTWTGKGVYVLQVYDSNNTIKVVKKIILQ
jgi:hypothetical protein